MFLQVVDSTVAYDSMFEKPAHSFKFVDILPRNEEMDLKGGNMKERMGNPHSGSIFLTQEVVFRENLSQYQM